MKTHKYVDLDETNVEDRFYNLGRRCVKRLKGKVR